APLGAEELAAAAAALNELRAGDPDPGLVADLDRAGKRHAQADHAAGGMVRHAPLPRACVVAGIPDDYAGEEIARFLHQVVGLKGPGVVVRVDVRDGEAHPVVGEVVAAEPPSLVL